MKNYKLGACDNGPDQSDIITAPVTAHSFEQTALLDLFAALKGAMRTNAALVNFKELAFVNWPDCVPDPKRVVFASKGGPRYCQTLKFPAFQYQW